MGLIPALISEHPLLDEIIRPYRSDLGEFHGGLRSHAYRMLNFGRCLAAPTPERDERLSIVAAFHDLPAFLDWNLETYIHRAADLAARYVESTGHPEWEPEIRLMIENHHKVRPYRGPGGALVEATRQADWIDVSCGRLRFGIPRPFLAEVDDAFPFCAAYRKAVRQLLRYAVRHPLRPLPMLRW